MEKEEIYQVIAKNLVTLRKSKGLSRKDVAKALWGNENRFQTIGSWERAEKKNQIKADDLLKIANYYDVSIQEIVEDGKTPSKKFLDNISISNDLGLSVKAIEQIKSLKKKKIDKDKLRLLSALIELGLLDATLDYFVKSISYFNQATNDCDKIDVRNNTLMNNNSIELLYDSACEYCINESSKCFDKLLYSVLKHSEFIIGI